jgi:N-acyl-D-aspartate/D-glutamate deacylase
MKVLLKNCRVYDGTGTTRSARHFNTGRTAFSTFGRRLSENAEVIELGGKSVRPALSTRIRITTGLRQSASEPILRTVRATGHHLVITGNCGLSMTVSNRKPL